MAAYDDGCKEDFGNPCGLEAAYCESTFGFAGLRPWGHVMPRACTAPEPRATDCATSMSLAEAIAADTARRENGTWVPACGRTEEPFTTRTGRRLLYCWQPSTGAHAYLDCETDLILSDDEARVALGM